MSVCVFANKMLLATGVTMTMPKKKGLRSRRSKRSRTRTRCAWGGFRMGTRCEGKAYESLSGCEDEKVKNAWMGSSGKQSML